MYQYDAIDKSIVKQRAKQFRGQVERHLAGKLSASDLAPLRLRNGLYMQIHAHMLRVSIPYGLLSADQLRKLAYIADTYDRGYAHFTTRQNIQYNWPELTDVPSILDDLSDVEMHAMQTSGNCIRNISSDQYAGVAHDEIEDPRPYCEIIRQWSTLHPEFYWLPRKFKVAVTGATHDRAAIQFHDIGLQVVKQGEQIGFKVFVGGGLGRTPVQGKLIKEFLPKQHILSYCDAILRVYNLYGRRDNKYKARIKILVNALGIDEFKKQVEQEWSHVKDKELTLKEEDFAHMANYFTSPDYLDSDQEKLAQVNKREQLDTKFSNWLKQNTCQHKVENYRIVNIPLKLADVAPGDITAQQMQALADIAEQYSMSEIRVTHEQNLVLADVNSHDLLDVWKALDNHNLAVANYNTINDMICCPGLDYCSLANTTSIPIAKQINQHFNDQDKNHDIGSLKIKISGCMNACGHHHVGHIGILGVDKKGEEWFQFTLGGDATEDAALGTHLGKAIAKEEVSNTVDKIVNVYLEQRNENEAFLQTFNRIGIEPFKQKVYDQVKA